MCREKVHSSFTHFISLQFPHNTFQCFLRSIFGSTPPRFPLSEARKRGCVPEKEKWGRKSREWENVVRRHTEKVSEVGFLLLPIPFFSAAPILYLLRHTRSFAFRVCTFFLQYCQSRSKSSPHVCSKHKAHYLKVIHPSLPMCDLQKEAKQKESEWRKGLGKKFVSHFCVYKGKNFFLFLDHLRGGGGETPDHIFRSTKEPLCFVFGFHREVHCAKGLEGSAKKRICARKTWTN